MTNNIVPCIRNLEEPCDPDLNFAICITFIQIKLFIYTQIIIEKDGK